MTSTATATKAARWPATFRRIVQARYPEGLPQDADFRIEEVPARALEDGEIRVRVTHLGLEPRLRLMLNPTREWNKGMRPLGAMTDIGRVIPGSALGEVVESRSPHYPVGDLVEGMLGWQEYAITTGERHPTNNPEGIVRCDRSLSLRDEDHVAVLGIPGLTAHLGVEIEGRLVPGETVVVTSAAGMVGSIAGQLARLKGARVIGITGSEEKRRYLLDELKFDAALSYRDAGWLEALRQAAPNGVDYYFDNVGGEQAAAIRVLCNAGARVTRCGIVSNYNVTEWNQTEQFAGQFSVHDHVGRYRAAREALSGLLKSGQITYRLTLIEGLEAAPAALRGVLQGKNIGRWLVRVDGGRRE